MDETEAAFTFSASEPGDFECRLDSGDYVGCDTAKTYSGLSEGPHTFRIRFTDAGGRSVTDADTWTVDTVAPAVSITSGPPSLTKTPSATFAFSASGGAAPVCLLDGVPVTPCASPKNVAAGHGSHTFEVRSTDAAGNTGSDERAWTVDTVAPETSITSGPPAVTTSTSGSVGFASDDAGAGFQCSLDGATFGACGTPQALAGLGTGDHSFRVRAVDAAGNTDGSPADHRWRVEPPPSAPSAPSTPQSGVAPATKTKPKCKKRKGGSRAKGCKPKRKKG